MTLKNKILMTAGALSLAALGITGALAAHASGDAKSCPKADCAKDCPKGHPCPDCPDCPGR